jgi:hypothetical protein
MRHPRQLMLLLIGVLIVPLLAACQQEEPSKLGSPAERTATYEAMREEVLANRKSSAVSTGSTPTPYPTPIVWTPTPGGPTPASASADPVFESAPDLSTMLPTIGMFSTGWLKTRDGELTREQVIATFPDPVEQAYLLDEWGFRQAYIRQFQFSPMLDSVGKMDSVMVIVAEYDSGDHAIAALDFNREFHTTCGCYTLVDADITGTPFGETKTAMSGPSTSRSNESWAFQWIQQGNIAWSFRASGNTHDPIADLQALVNQTFPQE